MVAEARDWVQTVRDCVQHKRQAQLSPALLGFLDTLVADTESFRDPCTQEELQTETQCVPLQLLTLEQWSDTLEETYKQSDASDLLIMRRRQGYGESVGYADRIVRGEDEGAGNVWESDVHFAKHGLDDQAAKRQEEHLMPCAVILGPAACGKTTLLNRIACGQARDALCGYLGALVPYVVPVMQFASWLLANESSLPVDAELVLEFMSGGDLFGILIDRHRGQQVQSARRGGGAVGSSTRTGSESRAAAAPLLSVESRPPPLCR